MGRVAGAPLAMKDRVMRVFWLATLFLVSTGCSSDTLDDTTYRRLVDQFDSYDQCLSDGNFAPCYNTLTFCADGSVNANLEFRQEGHYEVHQSNAIAELPTVTVIFDLDKQTSTQLPGRHPWELVEPLLVDCATH
jgi:hypothetical protein